MSLYSVFIYTVPFLAVLTLIVFFHEMGHFLVGRWCGVRIDAFSLGFGPELAHYVDRRGTRWRLAVLPLGGYVKFHGDADGASMTHPGTPEMPAAERATTLFGQSVGKRMAVVAAGPIANFIVAIAVFAALFFVNGRAVVTPRIGAVQAGSAAAAAGFKPGDLITAIDGVPLDSFEEMQRVVQSGEGGSLAFGVTRDGRALTLDAQPRRQVIPTMFGPLKTNVLGVVADSSPGNVRIVRSGLVRSLGMGAAETWFVVTSTGHYLQGLVAGRESFDQASGPIRIAQVSGKVAQLGIAPLLNLAAVLSVSIGLLNLLPIPVLDGGFLLFFTLELIRGKALKERTMEVAFRVGLTFVAAVSIFVAINDLSHPLSGKGAATPPPAAAPAPAPVPAQAPASAPEAPR